MRIYFLSAEPAALKLDGQYVGTIDMFERYAEIDCRRGAFAEIAPHSCRQTLNFFIDENFFKSPHGFCKIYSDRDERAIYIDSYARKCGGIEIIAQGRAAGTLLTVFRFGEIYAAAEAGGATLTKLCDSFEEAEISTEMIGGCEYAAVRGRNAVTLFRGEHVVFFGGCGGFEAGRHLTLTVNAENCTRTVLTREYTFDGEKMALVKQSAARGRQPAPEILPFAFFESVLLGGCEDYLCDELKDKTPALKEYLGKFTAVAPPSERAQKKYGEGVAALIYPEGENMFEIKYFVAEIRDGKIANIYPAE